METKDEYQEFKQIKDGHSILIPAFFKSKKIRNKILKKFEHIGFLDYKIVIEDLKKYDSITDKLDYLKTVKEKYYDKYSVVLESLSREEHLYLVDYENNNTRDFIWESIFGKYPVKLPLLSEEVRSCPLISPLHIQKPVYDTYFKNGLENPEFTYWFLKYNAAQIFDWYINDNKDIFKFQKKLNSNLRETFIKAELKKLNDLEEKANNLLLNDEVDIYKYHQDSKYHNEVILLRVLDGKYYKRNTTFTVNTASEEAITYANHILLKPYLEKQLKNNQTSKIQALFQFINFLHTNIDNFNQYNDLIKELELLIEQRKKLNPENNYKDKLQYDQVQAELESKFKTLQDNTANLIKSKAKELNVCNFDNEPNYNFDGIEVEIRQLKKNFGNEDLPEIFKYKNQYIEYRSQTHKTFLSLQFFFDELDEIAKSLFDYFKDTEQNEFEPFETKAIQVNSIEEVIKGFKQEQTKFTLSTQNEDLLTTSKEEEKNNLTVSTIEGWLIEFKEQKILIEKHYKNLVTALNDYFEKGTFPKLENKIKVGRVNKKRFGWVLNRIFHAEGKGIEIDLLRFAKDNISIFEDVNFDEDNLQKSNLYKYFTTNTKQHRKH